MQYILSEEEYTALKEAQTNQVKLAQKKLQTLCSKICDTMPVECSWEPARKPAPRLCILTLNKGGYCDDCPVTEICPHPLKGWSK